jgi:hypothetical protein
MRINLTMESSTWLCASRAGGASARPSTRTACIRSRLYSSSKMGREHRQEDRWCVASCAIMNALTQEEALSERVRSHARPLLSLLGNHLTGVAQWSYTSRHVQCESSSMAGRICWVRLKQSKSLSLGHLGLNGECATNPKPLPLSYCMHNLSQPPLHLYQALLHLERLISPLVETLQRFIRE